MRQTSITILKAELDIAKKDPKLYFGDKPDDVMTDVRVMTHPDRFEPPDQPAAIEFLRSFKELFDRVTAKPVVILSKKNKYFLHRLKATGDISDVWEATDGNGFARLVKVSRIAGGDVLMANEVTAVTQLRDKLKPGTRFWDMFPTIVESFKAKEGFEKRVTVMPNEEGWYTVAELVKMFPGGIDPRHCVWMYRRMLSAVGFAHRYGLLHRCLTMDNILIDPQTHSLRLIDWKFATGKMETLDNISSKYKYLYPPEVFNKTPYMSVSDIYMISKIIELVGNRLPPKFRAFTTAATLTSVRARPSDAWDYLESFTEMARTVFGPPKFIEMILPPTE